MSFQQNALSNHHNNNDPAINGISPLAAKEADAPVVLPKSQQARYYYGALCTDSSGLCLGAKGNIESSKSGVYATILRLASQLDGCSSSAAQSNNSSSSNKVPFVSIETDLSNIVIKEYNGAHTVVVRIPTEGSDNNGESNKVQQTVVVDQGHALGTLTGNESHPSSMSLGMNSNTPTDDGMVDGMN
eukprot:CAMPEP_0197835460 /NCGR_PEP_ID=MMETSP1437-20131217/25811_1 /TAXON_ID=49252 ORGANISM="Eucampia antarctica, Strain CCMP1452" /NCGR_SAMPLE_ID=MMETSP1437 /ASSEMBLY_ACC=CAM_ASM_001096 /LENGTH=186 /DNA_ID=CAMNT_0043440913 /DNA_START=36 /DNA_END=596 /DNA_ORIENTATION=-